VNLFGQIASLLTPFIIGSVSKSVGGLGNAVAIVSIGPLLGALLVWRYAPETRGLRLEELSPAAAAD